MYNLFLDDIRDHKDVKWGGFQDFPYASYVIVKNYKEFVNTLLNKGIPNFVSFDHDLSPIHYNNLINGISNENCEEKTGYDCAKFLFEFCLDKRVRLPQWHVHSMNPIGKERIENLLNGYERTFNAFYG